MLGIQQQGFILVMLENQPAKYRPKKTASGERNIVRIRLNEGGCHCSSGPPLRKLTSRASHRKSQETIAKTCRLAYFQGALGPVGLKLDPRNMVGLYTSLMRGCLGNPRCKILGQKRDLPVAVPPVADSHLLNDPHWARSSQAH